MGVRGVAGVCGGTALVTQLDTVTRPLDKSEKKSLLISHLLACCSIQTRIMWPQDYYVLSRVVLLW